MRIIPMVILVSLLLTIASVVVAEEDITPPSPPTVIQGPTGFRDDPLRLKIRTITLTGGGEAGATIRVYTSVSPFLVDTIATTTTVAADNFWSASVTLTPGVLTKISVSQVDNANNESEKITYSYVIVDATAPTISNLAIDNVAYTTKVTTDKSSIKLTGKVIDDICGSHEITLAVGYADTFRTVALAADGTFSTIVPLSEGLNIISLTAIDLAGNVTLATSLEIVKSTPSNITLIFGILAVVLMVATLTAFYIRLVRRD